MKQQRIAVVTGANRGLGFEICRQLALRKNILVVLTSRDEDKGLEACQKLQKKELAVSYAQLDVTSAASINRFAQTVRKEYGRCDILVNNAGVFLERQGDDVPFSGVFESALETIRQTMETNVYGPLLLCQALVPLMKENKYGRIVNMSSGLGQLSDMAGGYTGYRLSKVSINALTRILTAELKDHNILVNSLCPGWVRTDMGGPDAPRSVAQGTDTAVWLATLPDNGPRGRFFRDRKEIPW